jgi:hypothetical protein
MPNIGREPVPGKTVVGGRAIGYLDAVQTKIVQNKTLVVTPGPGRAREGWAEAARQMRERGDDLTPEPQEWQQVRDEWDDKERTRPALDSDETV